MQDRLAVLGSRFVIFLSINYSHALDASLQVATQILDEREEREE